MHRELSGRELQNHRKLTSLYLLNCALTSPCQAASALTSCMAEAVAGDVVVTNLDNELGGGAATG